MSDVTDLKAEVLLLRKENAELHADQAHWELGNCPNCPNIADLQEALEQSAKLRQQLADVTESMGRVEERCAKLRELCEEQLDNLMPEICAKAWWCEDKDWHTCNDDACGNYTFVILARELGIEVPS